MKTINPCLVILIAIPLLISLACYSQVPWKDNIHNPDNADYIAEVAFNLDLPDSMVTQSLFNERYLPSYQMGRPRVIYKKPKAKRDSTTNITYIDGYVRYPVYVTRNNKVYISRISKKGNYYRKYISLAQ